MSDTGYARQIREIVIEDEAHQKALHNLFLVCGGRLKSFHLHGRQWRLNSDTFRTNPSPPLEGWGTTFVTLHEVLGEEKQALAVDQQAILRGQWSGDQVFRPTVTQLSPGSALETTASVGEIHQDVSSAGGTSRTVVVAAVRNNQVAIQLAAFSLLASLDAKIEALREARSNSEDIAQYENLKRLVADFLDAAVSEDEAPIFDKTLSLAGGLKALWKKDSASICNKVLNMSLFASGLSICALAGAYGVSTASIVTVGALIGGKNVADSLAALAKMLPGKV